MATFGRTLLIATTATVAVFPLVGCGAQPEQDAATRVATDFLAAAAAQPDRACALLAPGTRESLEENAETPCATALPDEHLEAAAGVGRVEVAGHSAQVRLGGQAVFLARFDEGWKVIAAGCTREGADSARPWSCRIEG